MRLLIIDRKLLFREMLSCYLTAACPDSEIIEAADLDQALSLITRYDLQIDQVLMRPETNINGRFDTLQRLRNAYPDMPVAVLADEGDSAEQRKCFEMGARGYVPSSLSAAGLLSALDMIATGRCFMPPAERSPAAVPLVRLTPRELDVLELLCRGLPNKQIAAQLELQLVTIKLHVRGICRKLDATNRTQAALRGQALGFVKMS
jgi:DNA-binding NarL/FixJ family response regulator